MYKKIASGILLIGSLFTTCGCDYFRHRNVVDVFTRPFTPVEAEYLSKDVSLTPIRSPQSIVVCRSHQCAPAKLSMSKEYIYNSLLQLFDNNNYQKALICQADSSAHTCLENYVTIPLTSGITPTNAYIDYVKITDVIVNAQANKIDLILNYNVTYGGQTPECTPSRSILFAKNVNHVLLEDAGYTCKMTTIGQSLIKTVFAIDYIDLDYGYIGGFYSIGISGPAYGGSTGYMLLRLPKNAYPLSPQLKSPQSSSKKGLSNISSNIKGLNTPSTTEDTSSELGEVQVFPISK
ncbi:MAG: hypothetical protein E7012_03795 [Alphaproteobacteria bacterium]|nr:hypothetical protein [Alphaproteobacteria bacterium]